MGCDIHLCVEIKEIGQWQSVDRWRIDEDGYVNIPSLESYYDGRNYRLFAMLANVRNGIGAGGYDTGDPVNPIAIPKGLPTDVSPEVRRWSEQWGGDGHSHSWLTVAELLAYNWLQIATLRGYVDMQQYDQWDRKFERRPHEFYIIYPQTYKLITESEMKSRLELLRKISGGLSKNQYEQSVCHIEWQQPYYELAKDFWGTCMPRLLALGKPENVRIVFWFDN